MQDLLLLAAVGLTLTAGAWFLATIRGRLVGMPIGSGLLRGVVFAIAAGLFGALSVPGMIHLGFPVDVGLGGFLLIALLVFGIPTAVGFFWFGALIMPLGLLFTRRQSWPKVGTWVATVLAAVLMLVGYYSYQIVKADIDAPAVGIGTVTVDITGAVTPHATGSGGATCTLYDSGTFRADVGIGRSREQPIVTADGREITIQLIWPVDAAASVAITIGDRASMVAQDGVMTIRDGSGPSSGTMIVDGILPYGESEVDASDPWSGTVSWECPLR